MHTCEVLLSKFQSHHKGHLMRYLKSNHNKKTDAQICQLTFSWSWMLYLNLISLCVSVCGVCVCVYMCCVDIRPSAYIYKGQRERRTPGVFLYHSLPYLLDKDSLTEAEVCYFD